MKINKGRRGSTGDPVSPRKKSFKVASSPRGERVPSASSDDPSTPRSDVSEDVSLSSIEPDSPHRVAAPTTFLDPNTMNSDPIPRAASEKKLRRTHGEDLSMSTPVTRKKRESIMSTVAGAFTSLRVSKKIDKGHSSKAVREVEESDFTASPDSITPSPQSASDSPLPTRMKRSVSEALPKPLPRPLPRKTLYPTPVKKLPDPPPSPRGLVSPPKSPRLGPECGECGSEIVSGTVVRAMEQVFHEECFCCLHCERIIPMPGKYSEKNGQAFCMKCAEELFSPRCFHCDKPVSGKAFQVEKGMLHPDCYKSIKKTM